ncbi:nicotinamidase/pyrazinamidase [Candidatus Rubidus massiliensis]|nr:nicotinamidase/pyrazinamidase [Candidatus Rubidus massiliensis]
MTALLIVDVQNDFLEGGALGIKDSFSIIPIINALTLKPFTTIIATKDFHPLNHCSFATTHQKKVGETITIEEHEQILWPMHCVQGTKGSELNSQLLLKPIKHIVYKGTDPLIDSYSAFFDNNHVKETILNKLLQNYSIKKLFLVGLATDYCVKFTALDALELGFTVYIIQEGCKGVNLDPDDESKALQFLKEKGAFIITSSDVDHLLKS